MQMRPQAVTRMSRSCQGVLEFRQPVVAPLRGGVEFGRASHSERLMRTFGVELAHEGIEPGLLLQTVEAGRGVASFLRVKCMRSWRPFCCGWPGLMRSMAMPRRSHQTDRRE